MKSKCVIIENYTQYTNSERNKSPSRFEIFKDLLDFAISTRLEPFYNNTNNFREVMTYSIKTKFFLFTHFIINIHYVKRVKLALYIWYQLLCILCQIKL